jgi:DNA-binding FadR family transcriptional regulator
MFKSPARHRLSDQVAEQIARAIERGQLAAEDALPSERELMKQFEVGRTTVREALLALAQRRLISIQHGRKTRVLGRGTSDLSRSLEDVLSRLMSSPQLFLDGVKELRLTLEIAMAARAAEIATEEGIRSLESALAANRRAISNRDEYLRTDIAFHEAIAAMTGNIVFQELSAQILSWLARNRVDMVHVEGANLLSHDEHAEIAAAIAARDPVSAAEAMRRHQLRSHSLYGRLSGQRKKSTTARIARRKPSCSRGGERRSSRSRGS